MFPAENKDEPERENHTRIGWSATAQIAQLLMQIAILAILARLLVPSDFGMIAMVVVFSNFVSVFANFGPSSALVQKKEISDEMLYSTFLINVGPGRVAKARTIKGVYHTPCA